MHTKKNVLIAESTETKSTELVVICKCSVHIQAQCISLLCNSS